LLLVIATNFPCYDRVLIIRTIISVSRILKPRGFELKASGTTMQTLFQSTAHGRGNPIGLFLHLADWRRLPGSIPPQSLQSLCQTFYVLGLKTRLAAAAGEEPSMHYSNWNAVLPSVTFAGAGKTTSKLPIWKLAAGVPALPCASPIEIGKQLHGRH
jgi:hypothetical protein